MKVLYVSQFYYPERAAGAFRAVDNSKIWSEAGNDITVFTTYPNFPTGEIFKGYSNKLISREKIGEVTVIRNKIIPTKNTTKLKRAISSISFMLYSIYNIIFNNNQIGKDFDMVLGTSGTILAPIIAYIFAIKNKLPFILELRDITYEQILAVYNGKKTLLYYLVKFIELYLCKRANKVIVVTNGFREILIKHGIEDKKIEVIPNGAIIENKEQEKIKYLKDKETITLSYIGNIGGSQNLFRVIDVFSDIKIENKKKQLLIIGDGGKKEELKRYIEKKKINNINILDGMEYSKLSKYYDESDFCIVSLNNNKKFTGTIPSKIFTIMQKKKAVIFLGPKGEASDIVEKAKCGMIYNSLDYKEVANNISYILNKYIKENKLEDIINEYGQLGQNFVDKYYNRKEFAKKYISIMKEVIKENNELL